MKINKHDSWLVEFGHFDQKIKWPKFYVYLSSGVWYVPILTVEFQIRGYKYNSEVLQIFFVDIFQNEMMASLQNLGQFLLNKLCISKLLLHFCSWRSEIQIKTTFQYNHLYLKSSFSMISTHNIFFIFTCDIHM